MPLGDVVRAATEAPAKALRRTDLGSFRQGSAGDASALKLESGEFDGLDGGTSLRTSRLSGHSVVLNGHWWNG